MDAQSQEQQGRWSVEHVLALAPSASAAAGGRSAAVLAQWAATGCDGDAVWGRYTGSSAEPYHCCVELVEGHGQCSCPSRQRPCKHALGLLLLWVGGHLVGCARPAFVADWLARRPARPADPSVAGGVPAREADPEPETASTSRQRSGGESTGALPPVAPGPSDRRAAERAARVAAGLTELDRWLADCVRGGLTAPAIARQATWEGAAARLVDAQAGSLANRVRRIGTLVGVGPDWHEAVLAELGVLHLLAQAGRRLAVLEEDLADSVRSALGWTVRQADVLDRAPETDRWQALGRSDTLEDRIVVRRWWLRGESGGDWALLLSFAAYGQQLDGSTELGRATTADLHRYPGRRELRCIVGRSSGTPERIGEVRSSSLAGACDEVGRALGAIPWLERWPVTVHAAPSLDGKRWVLTDHTGSLPIAGVPERWPAAVAVSGGRPQTITAEWTPAGLIPLAVHLPDRSIDLGPRGGFHERRFDQRAPGERRIGSGARR